MFFAFPAPSRSNQHEHNILWTDSSTQNDKYAEHKELASRASPIRYNISRHHTAKINLTDQNKR